MQLFVTLNFVFYIKRKYSDCNTSTELMHMTLAHQGCQVPELFMCCREFHFLSTG